MAVMMTLPFPFPPSPPVSNSSSSSSSEAAFMDSARNPRPLSRSSIDNFRSPSMADRSPAISPHRTDASPPDGKTPRTAPMSVSGHDYSISLTSYAAGGSGGSLGSIGLPVLTIRRSLASLNPSFKEPGHIDAVSPPPRHHRRRRSSAGVLASSGESLATSKSADDLYCAYPGQRSRYDENSYSTSPSLRENVRRASEDPTMFSVPLDGLESGQVTPCDEEICDRHHHRQSVSSTVSITCSERDWGSEDGIDIGPPSEDEEIETHVAMEPMAPTMLIPLVDRPDEMKDILNHPANQPWVKLAQKVVGPETYQTECLPLWVETPRRSLPDMEWLRRTKGFLWKEGCGGICDRRLWNEFCDMVGWNPGENIGDDGEDIGPGRRAKSQESLNSDSSAKMLPIAEEEEETPNDEMMNMSSVSG